MARTILRQESQIRQSDLFDDSLAAGATLESGSASIEGDLNALRSQVNRILDESGAGNWHDDIATVNSKKRSIKSLNTDLDDIEIKPLLFRTEVLTDISVTAAQNWEVLSVAGSEAPSQTASVGAVNTEGAVVAAHGGTFGTTHSLAEVAGPNALRPLNLCEIVDATTGDEIFSGSKKIWALLHSESATDGHTFNDTTEQVQLSFVIENATADDLIACPVGDIAGKTINYSYVRQVHFDNIPRYAFLGGAFVDQSASVDVTLDNAIDNQSGAATQGQNIDIDQSAGIEWCWRDALSADVFCIKEGSGGGTTTVQVAADADVFDVDAVANNFLNGASFDTGAAGTTINIGTTANQIDAGGALSVASGGAADLNLVAALELNLTDSYRAGSTWSLADGVALANNSTEWNNFETRFGEVSLMNAIVQAYDAVGNILKTYAVLTTNVNEDIDVGGVGGGANLDVQIHDLSGGNFLQDHDVFLNGNLLRPGAADGSGHDYYPGTSLANGQLKFELKLKTGDQLAVISRE